MEINNTEENMLGRLLEVSKNWSIKYKKKLTQAMFKEAEKRPEGLTEEEFEVFLTKFKEDNNL